MQIHDVIGLVGDQRPVAVHPQRHIAAQHIHRHQSLFDQGLGGLPTERNHLHRQRKRPELRHFLGSIGDHDHLVAGRGHDLFLQQRRPAALDQTQIQVELIRTVNRQVQPFDIIQRGHRHPDLPRQFRRAHRGRHPHHPQAFLAHPLAQTAHHPGCGRAGAKPHFHPRFHKIDRPPGGHEFGLVDRRKLGWHGSLLRRGEQKIVTGWVA